MCGVRSVDLSGEMVTTVDESEEVLSVEDMLWCGVRRVILIPRLVVNEVRDN